MLFRKKRTPWISLIIVSIIAVLALGGCDSTGAGDTTAVTVSETTPADAATDVAISTDITATFSEAMDSETVTATSFTLADGTSPVEGTVTYDEDTHIARFSPAAELAEGVIYTATITTGAVAVSGNLLEQDKVWTFTTVTATGGDTPGDTTAPTVSSTAPGDAAVDVAINDHITATFSEDMDPATITAASTFTLKQGTTVIAGSVTYTGDIAVLDPDAPLLSSTVYTATVSVAATDLAGNPLAEAKVWTFTTASESTLDTTAPTILSTTPADAAVDVAINSDITVTFSENMDPLTITETTFMLKQGTNEVTGTVTYTGTTAIFSPTVDLVGETVYTATVTTGVEDLASNALVQNKVWTFTTAETGPNGGPAAVDLGTAANYAILAKTGVSTTGSTMVTGDIGLSPADQTALTGFSETMDTSNVWSTSAYVTGKLYASDYTVPTPANLTTAVSDMEAAYTAAAGLVTPDYTDLGAGEIGGLTLEPGLYKWGTGVTITTDVTLWGSDTATWVFQIADSLTLANGVTVTLAGGALPENIIWQVGSNASLGTTSHFEGTLLAKTNIPVGNGASVNGRLLAQTAVTLDANAITAP